MDRPQASEVNSLTNWRLLTILLLVLNCPIFMQLRGMGWRMADCEPVPASMRTCGLAVRVCIVGGTLENDRDRVWLVCNRFKLSLGRSISVSGLGLWIRLHWWQFRKAQPFLVSYRRNLVVLRSHVVGIDDGGEVCNLLVSARVLVATCR